MEMTPANLKKFRADFENTVKSLEKEYEVSINLGNMRYSKTDFKATLSVENPANGAEEEAAAQARFELYAEIYDVKPEWFGKTFLYQGKTYRVAGLNMRRPKWPIELVEVASGKIVKGTAFLLKMCIKE